MANILRNIFQVYDSERKEVTLFFVQSLFLGFFYGAFDIGAHALFLNEFEEDLIPKAYMVSGFVGIGMTIVFSFLAGKLNFKKVVFINTIFITILTILLRLGYFAFDQKLMAQIIFVLLGPLNILLMLGFWGLISRTFTLQQGKRLFGLIDSGVILGVILSSAIISLAPYLGIKIPELELITFSAVGVLLTFVMQVLINKRVNVIEEEQVEEKVVKEEKNFSFIGLMRQSSFVRYLALFVVLSMMVAFVSQYMFLSVTKARFPDGEGTADFLANFTLAMMIITLLIKTTAYNRLISEYGLKTTLIILPIVLALLVVIAAVIGFAWGAAAGTGGFMMFFIVISLARLIARSLRESLEVPSFKLLYHALDKKVRFFVQTTIDGSVNEFAALFSGLFLTGLTFLAFFDLLNMTFVYAGVIGVWVIVTIRLIRSYKSEIENIVVNTERQLSLSAMIDQLSATSSSINGFTEPLLEDALDEMRAIGAEELNEKANALQELYANAQPEMVNILLVLLSDHHPLTKKAALIVSRKYDHEAVNSLVLDRMGDVEFQALSFDILRRAQSLRLGDLKLAYAKSDRNTDYRMGILELIRLKYNAKEFGSFLMNIAENHPVELKHRALRILVENEHVAVENSDAVKVTIKEIGGVLAHLFAFEYTLKDKPDEIVRYFDKIKVFYIEILFGFLAVLYDKETIEKSKAMMLENSAESLGICSELLDLVLEDDLKNYIQPLVVDLSAGDKYNRLKDYYPIDYITSRSVINILACADRRLFSEALIILFLEFYISKVNSDAVFDFLKNDSNEVIRAFGNGALKDEHKEVIHKLKTFIANAENAGLYEVDVFLKSVVLLTKCKTTYELELAEDIKFNLPELTWRRLMQHNYFVGLELSAINGKK